MNHGVNITFVLCIRMHVTAHFKPIIVSQPFSDCIHNFPVEYIINTLIPKDALSHINTLVLMLVTKKAKSSLFTAFIVLLCDVMH